MTIYLAFERGIQLARRFAGRLQAWRADRLAARVERKATVCLDHTSGPFVSSHPAVVAVAILTCAAYGPGAGSHRGHFRYLA